MGGRLSKKRTMAPSPQLLMSLPHATSSSPNEATHQLEPDKQYFSKKCYIRNTLSGYEVNAVDFKYLKEAIKHLFEGNHEVVKMEFRRKNEFSELVMNYFIYCSSLEECLKKTSKIRLAINNARGQSGQEERVKCLRRIKEIESFKEYFQTHLMMTREISKKLQILNKKVNKRLKSSKRWRKVSTITYAAVSMIVPFTGMATAMVAPPLATALTQANTILLAFVGRWFDSFWKGKEKRLKWKQKVLRSMEIKDGGVHELNTILDGIYEVGIEFESFFENADLGEEDIVKKLGGFLKKIEDLCKQADMCSSYVGNARKGVLRSINEDPPTERVQIFQCLQGEANSA